ncbi:hypothetical protein MTR_3g006390 [Medicago truncatula]|uniref:Uncharacterized protein n=1 Tax=Medicago truncatula TaxID=3880 RepID=A0A072UUR8_MEDTR|nr:hypothetical protein MTR_3g006390 [Medicago truncatula]
MGNGREALVVDMATRGWGRGKGLEMEETPFSDNCNDYWKWLPDPSYGYSVHGAYHYLTAPDEPIDRGSIIDVWHKYVSSKVADNVCAGGCAQAETATHLFFSCDIFGGV